MMIKKNAKSPHQSIRRKLLVLTGISLCVFAIVDTHSQVLSQEVEKQGGRGRTTVDPDMVKRAVLTPLPPIKKATIKVKQSPNAKVPARLEVELSGDVFLPVIEVDKDIKLVREDNFRGDNVVYSAEIQFDLKAFLEDQKQRKAIARKTPTVPVFEHREIKAQQEIVLTDLSKPEIEIDLFTLVPLASRIDPERELIIRHRSVVENRKRTSEPCRVQSQKKPSMGKWSFGYLVTNLAQHAGKDPSDFVSDWLKQWNYPNTQAANGSSFYARPELVEKLLKQWPKINENQLNLAKAPFRLLAIVNRIDLRKNMLADTTAGEARFIFGAVDLSECESSNGKEKLDFTVILEYAIDTPPGDCAALQAWAIEWHKLGNLPFGKKYNGALQKLTEAFAASGSIAGINITTRLNQLRTNDDACTTNCFPGREHLREFKSPDLAETYVKQTPDWDALFGAELLGQYINDNESDILANPTRYTVPEYFTSSPSAEQFPFLGAVARGGFFDRSDDPNAIKNREARHLFSMNTCNGCHLEEVNSGNRFHVFPRLRHMQSDLSGFLTGYTAKDPADPFTQRTYKDLSDRAGDFDSLLTSCPVEVLIRKARNFVH